MDSEKSQMMMKLDMLLMTRGEPQEVIALMRTQTGKEGGVVGGGGGDGWLLGRSVCLNRCHSLVNCDHRDSIRGGGGGGGAAAAAAAASSSIRASTRRMDNGTDHSLPPHL
jgi:hypothetical protein